MTKILGTFVLAIALWVSVGANPAAAEPGPTYYPLPDKAAPPCVNPAGAGQFVCVIDATGKKNKNSVLIVRVENVVIQDWISDRKARSYIKTWRLENCRKKNGKKKPCDPFSTGGVY